MAGLLHRWNSRRYELSWEADASSDKPPRICIRIPYPVAHAVSEFYKNANIAGKLANAFDFDVESFSGDLTETFGFRNVLKCKDGSDWVKFVGRLPAAQIKDCLACGGSGKQHGGTNCRHCDGTGD